MNFDVGDVLTRAWQITWKHKVLWVFNMFPVLLSFLFIPIVFIPMFFIGPNALINQDVADDLGVRAAIERGWALLKAHFWRFVLVALVIYFGILLLSSIVTLPFMAPFFFLPLIVESSQTGFNFEVLGWILLVISLVVLPVLALVQGFSLAFMKSAFMIIYLRLTRSTVLQPTSQ